MLKATGFVLRRNDYREYDRIYTVYTFDYGKISLLVRGARRIKSKLAPHLENFGEVRINFAKGKVFNHVSGSRALEDYKNILKDNFKINFAAEILGLLDKFIKPDEVDENIYNLIKHVLGTVTNLPVSVIPSDPADSAGKPRDLTPFLKQADEISRYARNDINKLSIYFFWRLVDLLGYRPQLDECALCGRSPRVIPSEPADSAEKPRNLIPKSTKFNITDNIIICNDCVGDGLFIQEKTLENLRKIFQFSLEEFIKISPDPQLAKITEKAKQIKMSEL